MILVLSMSVLTQLFYKLVISVCLIAIYTARSVPG